MLIMKPLLPKESVKNTTHVCGLLQDIISVCRRCRLVSLVSQNYALRTMLAQQDSCICELPHSFLTCK